MLLQRNAVPQYARHYQQRGNCDDRLRQQAQFLRVGVGHRNGLACLTIQQGLEMVYANTS